MSWLTIQAGPDALQKIRSEGFSKEQVKAVFGASGAAKWLSIYGLDRAIFSGFLKDVSHEVLLFGTSVGAFKLAAACHQDPASGLDTLKHKYIHQSYPDGGGPEEIQRELNNIVEAILTPQHQQEILSHDYFRLACGTTLGNAGLASHDTKRQMRTCARLAVKNLFSPAALRKDISRYVFADARTEFPLASRDGIETHTVGLTQENIEPAIRASGAIPVSMFGVENVPGAPQGIYRDGGLLDYHPVPGNFWVDDGLILYPHFYDHCKVGWFDKLVPWRRASAEQLSNVLMISPSQQYLDSIELGRIPDRKDFQRFEGDDPGRIRLWEDAAEQSLHLGEEFLELAETGRLMDSVTPI